MRTLHVAYRVTDLATSLAFYEALGYRAVGRVDLTDGKSLTMLQFPGESVVGLELVHSPGDGPVVLGTGFSHLVVRVHDLEAAIVGLTRAGLQPTASQSPGGPGGPRTSWISDPDGYRIELVEWPRGHPDGLTAADFPA